MCSAAGWPASQVLESLFYALSHHEASICRGALESSYEFARRAAQHPQHAASTEPLLRSLLVRITADLLSARLHPEVIDPAAGNALLALIVAQPQHWQALAASVVEAQPSADGRERASATFSALLTSNGVVANLSRPNRQRFRANLEGLLQASRGLVLPHGGV